MDKLEEIVEKVLIGIDSTETESEKGWWETSAGAEFGRKKKLELIKILKRHLILKAKDGKNRN